MRRIAPWVALGAPTFPVLVFSVAARAVAGWDDGFSWGIAPFSLLYGLWNMAVSGLAALGCARLALRGCRAASDRRKELALAMCGVCGLLPWSLVVSVDCLRVALGDAWGPHSPFAWLRDWVLALPSGAWPFRPTSRVFWIFVGPGLVITALGLLITARFVPAAARLWFFLIWCPVLALLVSLVCGYI